MQASLYDQQARAAMVRRIQALHADSPRKWGKMTPAQMLAHCRVGFEVALGERKLKRAWLGLLVGWFAKRVALGDKPLRAAIGTGRDELVDGGAEIAIDGATAAVYGDRPLSGAPVMASDLRASAALILAALTAKGETWVQRLYHLDRGYERFEERLRSLGADIERLPASAMPKGFAED